MTPRASAGGRAFVVTVALFACAPSPNSGADDLPSPSALAAQPLTLQNTSPTRGLGPDLVFSRNATFDPATATVTLTSSGSLAVLRWSALTDGLTRATAFSLSPSPSGSGTDGAVSFATASPLTPRWPDFTSALPPPAHDDGRVLFALRNEGAAARSFAITLTTTTGALPAWTRAGEFAVPSLEEPSGIDWDHSRHTLWVIEDGGTLGRVNPRTGEVERSRALGGDLEAVRWIPALDLLLITRENDDKLLVVSPETLQMISTVSLVLATNVTPVFTKGGDGFEGLAVTAVQGREVSFTLANQNDPHCLYFGTLTIPAAPRAQLTATITSATPQPRVNLSEVMIDWGTRRRFTLRGYQLPSTLLPEGGTAIPLADVSAEGCTIAPDGTLWIANDQGGIARYRPE